VDAPYRGGSPKRADDGPRELGIVDELIRQFADPLAFYRELEQNGIDAGATQLVISISWDPDPDDATRGRCTIAVRDDGTGMDQETLETKLTVLFRSGKEGQSDKIGKFGVGFVSVLAIEPELVIVRTAMGDGVEWSLHLSPDQSYEIFRAPGGSARGTTVSLRVPMPAAQLVEFVNRSEAAITKWCRHVEIPVRLVAQGEAQREARIDRPFGVEGDIVVRAQRGQTLVAAGLATDRAAYLGFFKRGLLLYETDQSPFGAVAVKIQDPRLEHTLSRDNVRRDASCDDAIRFARAVIDDELRERARSALHAAASEKSDGYVALLESVARSELLEASEIALPRIGGRTITAAQATDREVYLADRESALSTAVIAQGMSVLWSPTKHASLLYARVAGRAFGWLESELSVGEAVERSESDELLVSSVRDLLGALVRKPSAVDLARVIGAKRERLFVCGELGAPIERGDEDPFRLLARPPLLLNVEHELVRAARICPDPSVAAAILARAILIERNLLDADRDRAWLEHASASLERG
jgi:hypothetical protein